MRQLVVACCLAATPVHAADTVTLVQRQFAATSPAAPFQSFVTQARRLAATTTPAWSSADNDLSAWGPALIFPLLDRTVATDTVVGLGAPLEAQGSAPILMFRTMGLYAAKSRLPFTETAVLHTAIDRNLATLEHATRDLEAFVGGPALAGWGSIGAGAWLAYLELLHRNYFDLGNPGAERWNADGIRIIDELLVRGSLPNGGFRCDPRDDTFALWPSVLAIHALVQAYENEELVKYESAAIATASAVETLRDKDGSYFSTSARVEKDPRANAYLAEALLLLFKNTGDSQHLDRAVAILRWLTSAGGAQATAQDAGLSAHVAYLALLLDSVATQPFENLLGRRPMTVTTELGAPTAQTVDEIAKRLRPQDFRYRTMFDAVLHMLIEHVPRAAGDVAYDYGDAPGYAAEVLLGGGDTTIASPIIHRQARLLSWPRPRDFDEISFGASALFAALARLDDADAAVAGPALHRYLALSGIMAFADRYYFDWLDWFTGGGGFDYGPTVIGAQIASAHLRYAQRFPGQPVGALIHPAAQAGALLEAANRVAWNGERHVYRSRPESETVSLLANAMMIIALVQAHQLTADNALLPRAAEVAAGLEPLWDDKRGAYFASSEQSGEDGYESLSTNSYAALALLRLHQATQHAEYHERVLRILDFINRDLYADGVIYHHLYRGRRAAGDVWCTGCNWRVLSVMAELSAAVQ